MDDFYVGDEFAYSRQSHQNRTPIRRPEGRMWLTVPLEAGSKGVPIRSVRISESEYDPGRLWRALRFNYEATPFFVHYADAVRELIFDHSGMLADLTVAGTRQLASWLRLRASLHVLSEIPPEALTLGDSVEGVNGDFVSSEETVRHDRRFTPVRVISRFRAPEYLQAFEGFETDLSGLDLLFNVGPEGGRLIEESTVLERIEGSVKPSHAEDTVDSGLRGGVY